MRLLKSFALHEMHCAQELLKQIVTLLHLKTYRDKLCETCFPSEHNPHRKLMTFWEGGQLREWRWSSLCDVVKALLRRESALKDCWDRAKFGQHGPDVSEAVHSPFFWAYSRFLFLISGMVDSRSEWVEGCSCHEQWGRHKAHKARKAYLLSRLKGFSEMKEDHVARSVVLCPFKGRRAPDLATGAFDAFVEDLMAVSQEKLQPCLEGLTPSQRANLVQDWMSTTDPITCLSHCSNMCSIVVSIMKDLSISIFGIFWHFSANLTWFDFWL